MLWRKILFLLGKPLFRKLPTCINWGKTIPNLSPPTTSKSKIIHNFVRRLTMVILAFIQVNYTLKKYPSPSQMLPTFLSPMPITSMISPSKALISYPINIKVFQSTKTASASTTKAKSRFGIAMSLTRFIPSVGLPTQKIWSSTLSTFYKQISMQKPNPPNNLP